MILGEHRIVPLSLETQSRIRSSVRISSLSEVILELIKNSLDAGGRHIDVRLDFSKGYCSILDDGYGIIEQEFLEHGGLVRLHHTSKGIDNGHTYGHYGRFLASLASLSILSIVSRHRDTDSSNSSVWTDGNRLTSSIAMSEFESGLLTHGTRVTVHNLFRKMPVRVKHRLANLERRTEVEKEFSVLKRMIVGLVLASEQTFVLDVREGSHRYLHRPSVPSLGLPKLAFDLEHIVSTLSQAGLLASTSTCTWKQASLQSTNVRLQAAISLRPAPSKVVQFISVNQYPFSDDLAKSLTELVNILFDKSAFGNAATAMEDKDCRSLHPQNSRRKTSTRSLKAIDRWPMFYIRVDTDATLPLDDAYQLEADKFVSSISGLLQALVTEFLQSSGLSLPERRTKARQPSAPLELNTDTLHFDGWSRIKSGTQHIDALQSDLLCGLPFMVRHNPSSHSSMRETEHENDTGTSIQWLNPRTGNRVQIDSRTGMALPSKRPEALTAHTSHRKLDDVMNSLSEYLPHSLVAPALKSVTPAYDCNALGRRNDVRAKGRVCRLQGHNSLCISGPASVEQGSTNLTKNDLYTAKVLGQVDEKFILASLFSDDSTLVMIDQHAADERIKIEELFEQLCVSEAVSLFTPIVFEVDQQEVQRFRARQSSLATWKIQYSTLDNHVRVTMLPELIIEKCRLEPQLLINLLRKEMWREHSPAVAKSDHWLSKLSACPQGVLDMLMSRACRSAIMFNDKLSSEECCVLVRRLSSCVFPFQCAHGRPSLAIVARIQDSEISQESTFVAAWKNWTD